MFASSRLAHTRSLARPMAGSRPMGSSSQVSSPPGRAAPIYPPPVVVIGAGLAGLSAAYEALAAGARVHMVERSPKPGGNSIKASSGINGVPTPFQPPGDSVELFKSDTVRSAGKRYSDNTYVDRAALVNVLTERSADAIDFLTTAGVDLSTVAALGGHSAARTHRPSSRTPPGAAIVNTLLTKLKANQNFTLWTDMDVTALHVDDGAVRGVTCSSNVARAHGESWTPKLAARAVVVATGGFANSPLLSKYRPDLAAFPSTNTQSPATAHELLEALGAPLVDMDAVQIHPTGFVDPNDVRAGVKFLAAEALRGEGGILLRDGRRFVNELSTRKIVSEAIMQAPPASSEPALWDVRLLLDPGACAAAASHIDFYVWKGLMQRVKLSELDETTQQSVNEYAAAVAAGHDPLGRKKFGHWSLKPGEDADAEVCVGQITPVTHFTMGGVSIDTGAKVAAGIDGLYAAGEVTGGVHGDNRLGGSSLLECVVFGRIAGAAAGKHE